MLTKKDIYKWSSIVCIIINILYLWLCPVFHLSQYFIDTLVEANQFSFFLGSSTSSEQISNLCEIASKKNITMLDFYKLYTGLQINNNNTEWGIEILMLYIIILLLAIAEIVLLYFNYDVLLPIYIVCTLLGISATAALAYSLNGALEDDFGSNAIRISLSIVFAFILPFLHAALYEKYAFELKKGGASDNKSEGKFFNKKVKADSHPQSGIGKLEKELRDAQQFITDEYTAIGEVLYLNYDIENIGDENIKVHFENIKNFEQSMSLTQDKINEMKNIKLCPSCGKEIARDSAFCMYCGVSFSENTYKCSVCGMLMNEKANFCISCGAPRSKEDDYQKMKSRAAAEMIQPIICPNCGMELTKDDKFCFRCGTHMGVDNNHEMS